MNPSKLGTSVQAWSESDQSDDRLRHRLQGLIAGRLLVGMVLLGAMLLTAFEDKRFGEFTPRFILVVTGSTFFFTLLCAFSLPRTRHLHVHAMVQIAWDVLLTSSLVLVTGGAGSALSFLYGVSILLAGFLIGPRTLFVTAGFAIVLYTSLGIGLGQGWIPHPPDQSPGQYLLPSGDLRFAILSNTLGLLIVTLLSSNLASRLATAGLSAAQFARLNADIIRSIRAGIITTDLSGNIVAINEAGARILQVNHPEVFRAPVQQYLPLRVPNESSAHPDYVPARSEGIATRADGTRFPMGFSVTDLRDKHDAITGQLIAFQDLTEIAELREKAKRAEQLAALGRLAANLAHEIRNPLTSISGSVELVSEAKELGDEDRRLLNTVVREVERLNGLVNTMLDVAKPREPRRVKTNLIVLAEDVVRIARRGPAETKELHIEVEGNASAPVTANVDPEQLRQVLWNLIKNAIQASPIGGSIQVRIAVHDNDNRIIEIQDHGDGIAENAQEKIFDAFHSDRAQGVGLGLALVKRIVDAHEGSIEVTSTPGHGACFRVVLPAGQTETC